MIIEADAARIGLIVETVQEVLTVAEDRISPPQVGRGRQRIDEHAALQTRILLPPVHNVTEVIVTAEPPRGSPTPTLPPIVLVQLTAHPGRTALKP